MNARSVLLILLAVVVVLTLTVAAQDKKDAQTGSVSITGCFNKGKAADQYVIKDDKTGKETVVMGDAKMLAAHANNHQVTITGTMAKDKDQEVLRASDLKMIAVCK
ncbi:MAG TPA: hypothetical protein VFE29_05385 [Terriglobia bacterium]|nr:hypothetical protein [Terriglobia bacterium]